MLINLKLLLFSIIKIAPKMAAVCFLIAFNLKVGDANDECICELCDAKCEQYHLQTCPNRQKPVKHYASDAL